MKLLKNVLERLLVSSLMLAISACAVIPKTLDSQGQDDGESFARKVIEPKRDSLFSSDVSPYPLTSSDTRMFYQTTFARGDVLRFQINGMDQYNGLYKVTAQGNLDLPFASSFPATNVTRENLIENIENELVRRKWFYRDTVKVDLSLVKLAPIEVSVLGAVFNPGRVTINSQPIDKPEDSIQQRAGAFSSDRSMVSALNAAGGIRPDADTNSVYLKRGNKLLSVSLSSVIDGDGFVDSPTLINGDQILVMSTGLVDTLLIKPSQITPPGMRVFMSNLTAPALSNAQAAVGSDSPRLPYGSSLLDSAISANCIGGTHQANASRSIVMVTSNFGSKRQLLVRRSINQLLAESSNRLVNPYIMPNDGIACYDSRFTNFRDVARGIGELISPILLGRLL